MCVILVLKEIIEASRLIKLKTHTVRELDKHSVQKAQQTMFG